MTSLALKIIAVIAMTADHIGYCLPESVLQDVLRSFGRIAMPIFCFLMAQGYIKTSNRYKYLLRVAVAALISEVPYNLLFGRALFFPGSLNVMFSLFFGLLAIFLFDTISQKEQFKPLAILPLVLLFCIAYYLKTDYSFYCPLLVFLYWLTTRKPNPSKILLVVWTLIFSARSLINVALKALLNVVFSAIPFLNSFSANIIVSKPTEWGYLQLMAMFALIPILFYNGKPGPRPKIRFVRKLTQYSFYLFYPVHLFLLYLIFYR